jgi:hypothetical protein
LKHNKRLHKVRQVVERFFGRMKKHLNIVGTIYRGDLEALPNIWLVAVWLADMHIAWHPLNAADEGRGDGPDEEGQPLYAHSDESIDSSEVPGDSDASVADDSEE